MYSLFFQIFLILLKICFCKFLFLLIRYLAKDHTLHFAIEEIMTAGLRALIHDRFFVPHKE